ncbi:MAG: GAF domain-containing protein, partial [Halobaculum sp.]
LHDGAARLAAVRSVEDLYAETMGVAREVLDFDWGLLLVREGDRLVTVASSDGGWAPESEPLDDSLAGETVQSGAPRIVDDLADDDRARRHHDDTRSAISVPVGEDAVFQVSSTATDAFDATDLEVAQLLATHIEETRERLLAEADARSRSDRITALHRAATDLIDAEDAAAVYDRTVEIAAEVLQFDHCLLAEATEDGFHALASADGVRDPGERVANRGRGVAEETFRAGETIVVDDATSAEEAEPVDDSFAAALSVPFGEVGVFQAISTETDTYDETDRELAELLVSYATTTLERIWSEEALRESQRTIERLHEAATEIASAETETEVLDRAIEAAANVLAFDLCTIDLADDEEGMLYPVAISDEESVESTPSSIEDGIAGKTYREGKPFVVDDLAADKDADPTKSEYRSVISVPVGDIGVFQAVSTETDAFDDDDADRAELLMAHVAVSLERVHAETGLREERDRFSALFENIPDAVVSFEMLDSGPIVRDVNEAFEETFGYDGAELHGENLDDYIVPEADQEIDDDASELNERLRAGENVRKECRRLTANGVRDFLMYVVPLELGTENVAGYAIYSDITERKERERELKSRER